jgi:acyl-CoA oxidase
LDWCNRYVKRFPLRDWLEYTDQCKGVWATHSIVVAKLIIKGEEYGNHLFLTQIRDAETQELLPGVEIYELGPKAFQGMLGTDNGAMQFHRVRIPRSQMLARNAQVLRDGQYIKPKNEKHSYGSMVTVRALMAEITGWDLVKAVAVAYHYTTFRKQFSRPGQTSEEITVFDYASVKHRLLPLLAKATALVVVGRNIKRAYDEYTADYLKTGDFAQLEDFHLQTVGAKVYSTEITGHGIETCRIACGGHGYNALSGFGRMYGNAINAVTYEGDNYVVGQQVPRAMLKHYHRKSEASLPTLSYLTAVRDGRFQSQGISRMTSVKDWICKDTQQYALEQRLASLFQNHLEDTEAGKDTSYTCHALTMAHCDFVYWRGLQEVVSRLEQHTASFIAPMKSLAQVFSLSIIQNPHHPSLAQALPLDGGQQRALRAAYDEALDDLAGNHVGTIIDAYGLTEYELDSALAKSDQSPYEALFEGAKRSEMSGASMSHLWPMMVDTRKLWDKIGEPALVAKL